MTRIYEAGRQTSFSYDNNGNLLRKAVLDEATGVERVWLYYYNNASLMTRAVDPRGYSTEYFYDTYGNVQSTINSLGHLTSFSNDIHGNVLSRIDPNGVIENIIYDNRQRPISSAIAGIRTLFSYDINGQLIKISKDDGSFVSYEYDAAHRLRAVSDQIGNRAEYTLDLMSNRIGEQFKDPAGILRRQISRTFDALNRLQAVSGRESAQ